MRIWQYRESSSFRTPSRCGTPNHWSARAATATSSSLRSPSSSVKRWKTRPDAPNTFTRTSCWWATDPHAVKHHLWNEMFSVSKVCYVNSNVFWQTSELGVTEHIEGDPCKFALWAGRTPTSDNKTVLKVTCVQCVCECVCVSECNISLLSLFHAHSRRPPV